MDTGIWLTVAGFATVVVGVQRQPGSTTTTTSKKTSAMTTVAQDDEPLDIHSVLTHYGFENVPEGGGWRNIRCFFHDDRMASGRVSIRDGAYRCMACDAKGSALTLIQWKEQLEWTSAVRLYQEITGRTYHRVSPADDDIWGGISEKPRDYERGSSLFPDWFCGESSSG